jgi:hypothetical protein
MDGESVYISLIPDRDELSAEVSRALKGQTRQ